MSKGVDAISKISAKAVDKTCRNHGGCPYCESGRLHKYLRQMPAQDLMAFKARYKDGK